MIIIQLILFCSLFTLMVKLAVGNNALNGLYIGVVFFAVGFSLMMALDVALG